jgi:hypothetical protein
MAALDLFGRRWHLRVMWELREGHRRARREGAGRHMPGSASNRPKSSTNWHWATSARSR